MTAILKVDTIQDTAGNNIINESSDTITIGASGDTVNVIGTLQSNGSAVPTVAGGITNAQQWRLSANLTGDAEPIAANWEEADTDGYNRLGDAMTQSSGVFTFPATGYWLITFMFTHQFNGAGSLYNSGVIQTATNGSSFGSASESYNNLYANNAYSGNSINFVFDVTNTSTHKVRFTIGSQNNAILQGDTGNNRTSATFIRLGNT